MRTTLTIDDDLAEILEKESLRKGLKMKEIVNYTLRRGLEMEQVKVERSRFVVRARPLGLKADIDPDKMNHLADELEVDACATKVQ